MRPQAETLKIKEEETSIVASYNLPKKGSRLMKVPGSPPKFSPPDEEPELLPDTAPPNIDEHGSVSQNASAMEPTLRAIFHLDPDFSFTNIDLIADRKALGYLLRYAKGHRGKFALTAIAVGNTVILTRKAESNISLLDENQFRGFRQDYDDTHLTCKDASTGSYYRAIKYRLGSLNLIVRHGIDAYLTEVFDREDPLNAIDARESQGSGNFVIESTGKVIPKSAMLELSTKSKLSHQQYYEDVIVPDLWLSQIANYARAACTITHSGPVIEEYRGRADPNGIPCDASEDIARWEEKNQKAICDFHGELHHLLDKVRKASRTQESEKFLVQYRGGNHEFYSVTPAAVELDVPVDLRIRMHK